MTSSVKVTAHCGPDKVVVIQRTGCGYAVEETVLEDGESVELSIFDAVSCHTYERPK